MKKVFSLLVLCATVVLASCSKDDPATEPVPEGIAVTAYEALLTALQTGGTSADAPALVALGGDITIPAGGGNNNPSINDNGHFKIDSGGCTLTQEGEDNNFHFLGNSSPDTDAVYIELININLVRQGMNSAVGIYNGRITLGKNMVLNGRYETMVVAVGEKAVLELGDGCELSCTAVSGSCCVSVWYGATLVLNGGKTAAGAYIDLYSTYNPTVSYSLISAPKTLTGDVHLLFATIGVTSVAQGVGGHQLTQADCDRLKVDPESVVSLYGGPHQKYGGNFEFYLDPGAEHQIKLRLKNFTPLTSGNTDMTSMTADEAQLAALAAFAADFTEIKLTGELSRTGIGGNQGTFINNKKITKCDLTGVMDWGRKPTLPDVTFANCTASQEVTLPDDMKVIGGSVFSGCATLTTVSLSQVTWINLNAFWGCTSLETLALDNVTAIDQEIFYRCMGLEMLKIPKCIEFGTYIVTGCRSLTRVGTIAAGNFVDISNGRSSIECIAVLHNRNDHYGDSASSLTRCDLVLNADKEQGGNAAPKVSSDNGWLMMPSGQLMRWNSITFGQQ